MASINRTSRTSSYIVGQFDAHVQVYWAWRNRVTEAYWLLMVLEDRADCAPAPDLSKAPRNV
jgi:hypothetical protein